MVPEIAVLLAEHTGARARTSLMPQFRRSMMRGVELGSLPASLIRVRRFRPRGFRHRRSRDTLAASAPTNEGGKAPIGGGQTAC